MGEMSRGFTFGPYPPPYPYLGEKSYPTAIPERESQASGIGAGRLQISCLPFLFIHFVLRFVDIKK